MKGKDILRDLAAAGHPVAPQPKPDSPKAAGAVRAMNLGLDRLTSEAARARELQQAIAHGQSVIELDPAQIDPSFVVDRIPSADDPAYEELRRSIDANGQQVPVLVRPHPEQKGRYQAAYGHRRVRAARDLGRPVRAIVKELGDSELIVAQAQENGPRLDLSFVERALFANRLEGRGFTRDLIGKALGIDQPEVSRLLSVSQRIDSDIVLAIGPAPKVGRPRWLALADLLDDTSAVARARSAIAAADFGRLETNARFNAVLGAASAPGKRQDARESISDKAGRTLGFVERGRSGLKISVRDRRFALFLQERLPELLDAFGAAQAASTPAEGGETS